MDESTIQTRIKAYLGKINDKLSQIETAHAGLIDFCIDEVLDRVSLYLNSEDIPTKLERILASIVNNGLKRYIKDLEISSTDVASVDRAINSISDNGQSISYANEVTNYFTTASDSELFTGFESLLSRYRRIKVVYPKSNEERDS